MSNRLHCPFSKRLGCRLRLNRGRSGDHFHFVAMLSRPCIREWARQGKWQQLRTPNAKAAVLTRPMILVIARKSLSSSALKFSKIVLNSRVNLGAVEYSSLIAFGESQVFSDRRPAAAARFNGLGKAQKNVVNCRQTVISISFT